MTNEEKWRTVVMQWKASGLTAAEFGSREGVSKQQLHNWTSRLGLTGRANKQAEDETQPVRLLPIVRPPARPVAKQAKTGGTGIRLSFAGATMDLEAGFDPATLRKVLQVAQSIVGSSS